MEDIFKLIKKLAIVTFIIVVACAFSSNASYATSKKAIKQSATIYSDNTIVTEDNIISILDSLGIEHGPIEYSKDASYSNYTIRDLKSALSQQEQNQEISTNENVILSGAALNSSINMLSATQSRAKQKKMSITLHHDGFDLIHIEQVKYKGHHFTDVTASDIHIDSELLPIVYKITKERNISATISKTKVVQHFNIDVSAYVGIKYGLIKISTQMHKGYVNFYASNQL